MKKSIWTGLVSGLLAGGFVALIYVGSVSASLGSVVIPLPSIGAKSRSQEFVAPYSGEAFIMSELETTGTCLWGSILLSRKDDYKLNVHMEFPKDCNSRNYQDVERSFMSSTKVTFDGEEMDAEDISADRQILCYLKEFDVASDDKVRPARIRFACPVREFAGRETYVIHSYLDDKGGTVKRHDVNMHYTYRRPRFW